MHLLLINNAPPLATVPRPIIASCALNDQLPFHVTATQTQLQFHKKCNVMAQLITWQNFASAVIPIPIAANELLYQRYTGFS